MSNRNRQTLPRFCYQFVYCCCIQYFLVRINTAKCFTNRSKKLRFQVIFESTNRSKKLWFQVIFESTHMTYCEYTMFTPGQLFHDSHKQHTSSQGYRDSNITGEISCMGITDLLLISFLYHRTRLLLGYVWNGAPMVLPLIFITI
jgi:hypothetical protein